ncbi:MAG: T9SS type A sorting domain-containing protein, partial [Candidatus Cloacimonetes bacterium]|nr:T9SS type A sorting domain-containing protein [Candidatus Cloacimonadota bacterium]
ENDGDENFSAHTITTSANGAWSVYATDVDGDGDMDVLSASSGDDKIAWYENLLISGINDDNILILKSNDLKNFPNPFHSLGSERSPFTTIEFNLNDNSKVNLSIYNIKGQFVKTLVDKNLSKGRKNYIWNGINNQGLSVPSGIYLYKLEVDGKLVKIKKMTLIK